MIDSLWTWMTAAGAPVAVAFALVGASFTTIGILLVAFSPRLSQAHGGLLVAFAAGALITATLTHLLPDAFAAGPAAGLWALGGFAFGHLLNRGVLAATERAGAGTLALGLTPVIAIAIHSTLDGVAYAVTFEVDFATGLSTAIGLILHETPEGIITFALMQRAGVSRLAAAGSAFLAAAATTPLGALSVGPFLMGIAPDQLAPVFAATAGLLLYVAATHLLAHVEREAKLAAVPAMVIGGAAAFGATLLHGHGPGDGEHAHAHVHVHEAPETLPQFRPPPPATPQPG